LLPKEYSGFYDEDGDYQGSSFENRRWSPAASREGACYPEFGSLAARGQKLKITGPSSVRSKFAWISSRI